MEQKVPLYFTEYWYSHSIVYMAVRGPFGPAYADIT